MKVGIVGFAGAGKTTVFNALTGLAAEVGSYGGKDRPNLGNIKVPDARVDTLGDIYRTKKRTYAEVAFVDVAGPTDSARAGGLDAKLVAAMRDVDALAHVVRAFLDPVGARPTDPAADIAAFDAELILSDLIQVENRLERLKKDQRATARERELFARCKAALDAEQPLRALDFDDEEQRLMAGFRFLSLKPQMVLLNVAEADIAAGIPAAVLDAAHTRAIPTVTTMCGPVEMDIAQMAPEEQGDFLRDLGLTAPARDRFIVAAYGLLNLISFLTAGEDECRAWPIQRGTKAQRAAGKIHSDIERGFIRAEVIAYADFITFGSEAKCKEAGKLRLEGKDYVVQDGDIIHFRFHV
ncbi:MAG: redox-regulated ATPase YchF [Chloracidobacterium sp.]|nr:redox-regulated ATPase YchF [Chloracidobacterium sp.]MDW8218384.1 redox-regulated ATPase YchF [Acidobacteriota bacterium]